MSRTAERVARNASWSLASGVVAFATGAASSVVLARLLGPEDFGTYALVLLSGAILGILINLGIPHAATKYVAEYEGRGERETAGLALVALGRLQLAMAAAVAVPAFLVAPWLERVFHAPGFTVAFRILLVGLVPSVIAGLTLAGIQGFQDYRRATLISLAGSVFLFTTTVGLLIAGAGVRGAVGAIAATTLLGAVLGIRCTRRHVRPSLRGSLPAQARRKMRRYLPAVSAVLLLDLVVWQRSEVLFLGIFRSPKEVAWYALAFGAAATVMRLLPRALSSVLSPVASGLYGARDPVGMHILFRTGSRYLTIIAAPIVVGGAVLGRPLLTTVYGHEYGPAAAVFPVVLIAAGFGAVGSVTASIQTGIERQDLVLKVALVATAINLGLDLALIPTWGIMGAAVANAAAQTGAVVAGIMVTAPILGASFPVRDCLRVLAASGCVGAVAYSTASLIGGEAGLAGAVVAGAFVYPLALLLTRSIKAEDLDRLRALSSGVPTALRPGYERILRLAELVVVSIPRFAEGWGRLSVKRSGQVQEAMLHPTPGNAVGLGVGPTGKEGDVP